MQFTGYGTAFILLNSRMLRLNEVGTYIWERFEHGSTFPRVVRAIVDAFDTTETHARVDARAFVDELVARDALVPVSGRPQLGRSL